MTSSPAADALTFGWLPDLSVREVLTRCASVIRSLPYVLVSAVDSETRVGEMPWAQHQLQRDPSWAITVTPLVISGERLLAAEDDEGVFNGFDEIWIPSAMPLPPPPADANLVAPRMFDARLPAEVRHWMLQSRCRLGMGDGDGLNFVVSDTALARELALPIA